MAHYAFLFYFDFQIKKDSLLCGGVGLLALLRVSLGESVGYPTLLHFDGKYNGACLRPCILKLSCYIENLVSITQKILCHH